MEKALFGLTIMGMKSQEEDVAKLAIEFWCTVSPIKSFGRLSFHRMSMGLLDRC